MTGILRIAFVFTAAALLATACKSGPSATEAPTETSSATQYAPNPGDPPRPPAPLSPPSPIRTVAPKTVIPSGTPIHITLIDGVSSDRSSNGDQFMGSLSEAIQIDGKTVLEKGTKVHGRVLDANESGRVKGRASLSLSLVSIVRGNQTIPIETKPYVAVAKSTQKRDTVVVAGGTGVGAAIGAIAGGGKGAAVGALIGGGAGTGEVLATKGKDIRYPPETRLSFKLDSPLEL